MIQGGSLGGLGWWSDVCNFKNVCFLWTITVFWSGFFRLILLRVDCYCNRPSFLATVFYQASAFNGDLNKWDVAKVATMSYSKSIRVFENDLTWRELMLLWLESSIGVFGRWWWCDVKMVQRWCWRTREIKCTPMAHCNSVCGLWLRVIFLWDIFMENDLTWRELILFWLVIFLWNLLMIFHTFRQFWDFLMKFHAFWSLSQTRLFQNGRGFGVGSEEVMQRHACESEYGRKGGGGVMGNMLWRGESSWLCMKCEFTFFAGDGIFVRVLPPSFFAFTVNELCLLCRPNHYATSCFVLHIFRMEICYRDFSYEISTFFFMRFHASYLHNFRMRFPYESSCFLLHNFLLRFLAFCYIICLWDFLLLSCYEISLWDFILICRRKIYFEI